MRAIKFRMWDFVNEQMIDGDSLAFEEYAPISHLLSQEGVMQYTGLTDRNGKDIYEGDVLHFCDGLRPQYVRWVQCMSGFAMAISEKSGTTGIPEDCEVIGNIYDNPELLEVT